jgi:hypothetical protein
VAGIEHNRSLVLRAEMKLPGEAILAFRIGPEGADECELEQQALFKPRGLFGILYWYGVLPFHSTVFSGMIAGIRKKAIEIAADPRTIAKALPASRQM